MKYNKFIKITLGLIIIVIYFYLKRSIPIDINYDGVMFRLGEQNREISSITIEIKGNITKDLMLNKKFVGYINITGIDDLLDRKGHDANLFKELFGNQMEMDIDKFYRGTLTYTNLDYYKTLGIIYFDPTFSKLTISVYEKGYYQMWRASDGIMISAPATTREEALEIANNIFNTMGEKYVFK